MPAAAAASDLTGASPATAGLHDRSRIIHLASSSSSASSSRPSSPDSALDSQSTFDPPTFTIKELLGCIPSECFERSLLKSSLYVVRDLSFTAILLWLGSHIDHKFSGHGGQWVDGMLGSVLNFIAWGAYGYWMGLVWTGIWVLAHECGHQSFCPSKSINNFVGWVLHSALLVPFHSWRISHAQHHAATCHMARDQAFVPFTRSQLGLPPADDKSSHRVSGSASSPSLYEKMDDLLEDAPLWVLWKLFVHQSVGFAAYLLINASGQKHYPRWTNHFNPNSVMFDDRHRNQVLWSDLGIAITIGCLVWLGIKTDLLTVFKYYIVPYLVVHHWIVLITFLQHTDPYLPHYREKAFNFQRGALSTMDRKIHGFFTHGLAETHVAHHLCSKIPHYNAWKATEALKVKLGDHYNSTDENYWYSLWKCFRFCRFVEDEGDVVFYKDAQGRARRRVINNFGEGGVSDSGVDVEGSKSKTE